MNKDDSPFGGSHALRRRMLVSQCQLQRLSLAAETRELLRPAAPGGLLGLFKGNLTLPLTVAGVLLGVLAARPGRVVRLLSTGTSLWRLARGLLRLLHRPAAPGSPVE